MQFLIGSGHVGKCPESFRNDLITAHTKSGSGWVPLSGARRSPFDLTAFSVAPVCKTQIVRAHGSFREVSQGVAESWDS